MITQSNHISNTFILPTILNPFLTPQDSHNVSCYFCSSCKKFGEVGMQSDFILLETLHCSNFILTWKNVMKYKKMFPTTWIQSFVPQELVGFQYMPGVSLGSGDLAGNKKGRVAALMEIQSNKLQPQFVLQDHCRSPLQQGEFKLFIASTHANRFSSGSAAPFSADSVKFPKLMAFFLAGTEAWLTSKCRDMGTHPNLSAPRPLYQRIYLLLQVLEMVFLKLYFKMVSFLYFTYIYILSDFFLASSEQQPEEKSS